MGLDLLNDLLNEILVCSCNLLLDGLCDEEGSPCSCPCRLFISAGPPVWDTESCCSDGALSAHLTRIYPFANFPQQAGKRNTCQTPLAADVVVTLLRCHPSIHDDGSAPSHLELQAASEAIHRDLLLLSSGLLCCLAESGRNRQFVFQSSRILPPQGGCVGVEINLTVELVAI